MVGRLGVVNGLVAYMIFSLILTILNFLFILFNHFMCVNNVLCPSHPHYLLLPLLLLLSPPLSSQQACPLFSYFLPVTLSWISAACVLRVGVIYWTTGHFP